MIKSMTGYGRCEETTAEYHLSVEIKSVNHRYLELNMKSPAKVSHIENRIRAYLKEHINRGKVDVYIFYSDDVNANIQVKYNPEIAAMYVKNLSEMAAQFHIKEDITVSSLAKFPDVFEIEETDTDEDLIWDRIKKPLENACMQFVESRTMEGEHLKEDLLSKLSDMEKFVSVIEERSPVLVQEYKDRLTAKVLDLLKKEDMDEGRIAAEVTLYADHVCVDEEMVRLKSHIQAMEMILQNGGDAGRKMDFLAQEMNREANTILSKSTDVSIADVGIEMKTMIEKIREQIQNIE